MNTTLTCSFSVVVASSTFGLTLVRGLEAGTKVLFSSFPMELSSSSGVVAGVLALELSATSGKNEKRDFFT